MSVTSISRVLHASTARVRERGVDLEPTVDQLATVDTAVAGARVVMNELPTKVTRPKGLRDDPQP